jgi:glutamate dehydrogenase
LHDLLLDYFPQAATRAFPDEPDRHRLKKEIVSTVLTNKVVNLAGPVFVLRMKELSGKTAVDAGRAFVIADGAFDLSALKKRIDALDGQVPAAAQIRAYAAIALQVQRVAPWFLARHEDDIAAAITLYRGGVEALRASLPEGLTLDPDLPPDVARDVALLPKLATTLDIARLAADTGADIAMVAALHDGVGSALGLARLHELAARLTLPDHWDRLALRRLLDDLAGAQAALSAKLLKSGGGALDDWRKANQGQLARMQDFVAQLETSGEPSVAKLMLVSSQIQSLV